MGVILLIIGLGVLGFGLMQHLKGKRILAAPFKKTGDLARDPTSSDPKGAISTEGEVRGPAQALLSPCSKTPCLYYEVKIERLYEKEEKTQDGWKTVKGSNTLDTLKSGAVASLDDGSGAISVDFSKGADFDNLKQSFKKDISGSGRLSTLEFGGLVYEVPVLASAEGTTVGFKATEKLVPVEGKLFVLGKIDGGKIVKPGWRAMMASSKGRDGMLASTAKKKKFSFIGGGVGAVASIPLMIFGPSAPSPSSAKCKGQVASVQAVCRDNVTSKYGNDYTWTVDAPGNFDITVTPPAGKKIAFDPQIIVKNAAGEEVADQSASAPGAKTTASMNLKPGTYTITVKDLGGDSVKGGFDYQFEVAKHGAPAQGQALLANADAAATNDGAPLVVDALKLGAEPLDALATYDGKMLEMRGQVADVAFDVNQTLVSFTLPSDADGASNGLFVELPVKAKVKKGQLITVRGRAAFEGDALVLKSSELLPSGKSVAAAPKSKVTPKGKKVQPRNSKK